MSHKTTTDQQSEASGIVIPGYRIKRTLGRGGMATVYLAEQQSVQREVAIKVMSLALLGDDQFGERFLREARIAARMAHPNIMQVHDVGISGDCHYIAMEYLPGGPVMAHLGSTRSVELALQIVRQIASALDYAGARGVVHRDIKPDNILMREDGTAVLTDFGIARAGDAASMTRTGAIIGTPHYMSPEQARGLPLDGRSDIYSLGVVLYELLVGEVPYQAEDSLAVGIMHITAPLPLLPGELARFQPILDRMLAKDPLQRYQRGQEVVEAIVVAQQTGFAGNETRVVPVTPAPLSGSGAGMVDEPRLGSIERVLNTPTRTRISGEKQKSSQAKRWYWWGGGVLLLVALGGYLAQDYLREQLPQTRLNSLLQEAEYALSHDQLTGTTHSARELYLAVRAQDPDNPAARQGLQKVGARLLEKAHIALERGDTVPAMQVMDLAQSLSLPTSDIADLARALQKQESRETELVSLLDAARTAASENRLDGGENSAVALYQRVLRQDPGNAIAVVGLREALTHLLAQATSAAVTGDFDTATTLIDRVAAIDPAHLELPEARAALAQARQGQSEEIETQLRVADSLLAKGRLLPPHQPNAVQAYQSVLSMDPEQARARDGLRNVAAALVRQAGKKMEDYEFESADALLGQARQLVPDLPALASMQRRLLDVRQSYNNVQAQQARAAIDIPSALQQAREAASAGRFLVPPGESAYDLYRAILAQSPGNTEAQAGLNGLAGLAVQRFEEAMAVNRLQTAVEALEALGVVAPLDPRLIPARQRLARSQIAYASERLEAGELKLAQRAFDKARELDPANTDLPALQARLEQAGQP